MTGLADAIGPKTAKEAAPIIKTRKVLFGRTFVMPRVKKAAESSASFFVGNRFFVVLFIGVYFALGINEFKEKQVACQVRYVLVVCGPIEDVTS